jgi:hypothetical protein
VQNVKRTHGSEGATDPGRDGPRSVGLAHSCVGSAPFLECEDDATMDPWRRRHS